MLVGMRRSIRMGQENVGETQAHKDFLLIATRSDWPWAEWIAAELELAGATVFVEAWDLRPGQSRILALQQALANCEHALLVISPAFHQDELVQAQWASLL